MRPDLSQPENVWFIMVRETKEELRQPVHQPSADQLWQAVQAESDQLRRRPARFRRLAASIRTRLRCCVEVADGHTSY